MMASEATPEQPADAPASTSPRPVNVETSRDVDPKASVNGTEASADIANKRITSVEEQTLSTDVSVSGGSDTEGPKSDSAKPTGDRSHARVSSSVKKPATFKAVSVNKTFLASKAGFSPASSKTAEKAAATPIGSTSQLQSGLAPNRPRLVAKTGVGSRDSVPRSAANGGKPGAVPDPDTVWNKNRPVPTPEPKKLSDEELKKYGIHMANRLDSEDTKGQSNWADIDDDDDDWAPEAITWTDGTKSTLPAADDSGPPGETVDIPPSADVAAKEKRVGETTKASVSSRTASPTIRPSGIPSGKGLILKAGSAEKVTLVAKPPAPPTPAKSPWAPLPPIQKTAPVSMDPPVGRNSSRPPGRDPTHFRAGTREISADDFSRSSWRDGPTASNRELYNSQSGRYEPVPDRRGSFRADMQARPSLLQRPHPYQHGSGEPSPTFQPARPVQDGQFGRRRGSSNVSGGSGYLHRAGKAYEPGSIPPPDMLNMRRPSVTASIDSHLSPRNFSPSDQYGGRLQSGHAWQPRASPSMAHASPHLPHASPEPNRVQAIPGMMTEVQQVEYQTRLMHEKREQARKRRQEEEAREEAAKAERIRLKLEAMGPPPERKSARKETHADEKTPVMPTGEATPGTQAAEPSTRQSQVEGAMPSSLPPHNAKAGKDSASQAPSDTNNPNPWDGSSQPPPAGLTSWPSSTQQPSRNVWGSPNNNRGLGNGTFDPDLGRIPESRAAPRAQPQAKGPAPIAPPNAPKAPGRPQTQVYLPSRPDGRYAAAPESRPYNEQQNKWVNAVRQGDAQLRDERLKERAELDRRLASEGITYDQAQPTIKQTWRPASSSMKTEATGTRAQGSSWEPTLEEQTKIIKAARESSNSSQSRPSRFFPSKDKDTQSEAQDHAELERPKSPSPPPPTMDGHPVYDGDASHPQVSLPRPQPVVKLPPAPGAASAHGPPRSGRSEIPWQGSASHKAAQGTAATIHLTTTSQTPHSQQDWQKKIYELTGRRCVPKSPAVESSSRGVLDHDVDHSSAAVSLPGPSVPMDAGEVTSKDSTNECFEEPEMGSLPLIRLPHRAPYADWSPPLEKPIKPLPRNLHVVSSTVKSVDEIPAANHVRVYMPGMPDPRMVSHDFGIRADSRPSGQLKQGGRGRGSGSSYRGGGGSRKDSSSAYEYSGMQRGSSPPPHRGRNSYRGRSEPWSRRSGHQTN